MSTLNTNAHSHSRYAIIGYDCVCPGAQNASELYENLLSKCIEFRAISSNRMSKEYQGTQAHQCYSKNAAYMDHHPRVEEHAEKWPKKFHEAFDEAHWLALDVTTRLMKRIFGSQYPNNIGVIFGNTLTGEMTRTKNLIFKWPFFQKLFEASANSHGLPKAMIESMLMNIRNSLSDHFPEISGDTLAGALSSTIAGLISNALGLKNGAFTVDGACASSGLAIENGCMRLATGDIDFAVVGGVDISLDSLEMVGFSLIKALTPDTFMQACDANAKGFIAGEGCGVMILQRYEDAVAQKREIFAVIESFAISSDGEGDIKAPSVDGQKRAITAALAKLPRNLVSNLKFVKLHGTATPAGDNAEIQSLGESINAYWDHDKTILDSLDICVTTEKPNIGHLKAASGAVGMIVTIEALRHRCVPPIPCFKTPNPKFKSFKFLSVATEAVPLPGSEPLLAGCSMFGFGGINVHFLVSSPGRDVPTDTGEAILPTTSTLCGYQYSELFIMAAHTIEQLITSSKHFAEQIETVSRGEMPAYSHHLLSTLDFTANYRWFIVSHDPLHLLSCINEILEKLKSWDGITRYLSTKKEYGLNHANPTVLSNIKIGFLFPGQGSSLKSNGARNLYLRHQAIQEIFKNITLPFSVAETFTNTTSTKEEKRLQDLARKHPQIVTLVSSLIWAEYLTSILNITPTITAGLSLGEIVARKYAVGASFPLSELITLVGKREEAFINNTDSKGKMMVCFDNLGVVEQLLKDSKVECFISNINSHSQVVVGGTSESIDAFSRYLKQNSAIQTRQLPVNTAFHTPLCTNVAKQFVDSLDKWPLASEQSVNPPNLLYASQFPSYPSLRDYLSEHIIRPVNFLAVQEHLKNCELDCLLEVGSGSMVRSLFSTNDFPPIFSLEESEHDYSGFLAFIGFLGISNALTAEFLELLWHGRPRKALPTHSFLSNPSEVTRKYSTSSSDNQGDDENTPEDLSDEDRIITVVLREGQRATGKKLDRSSNFSSLNFSSTALAEFSASCCQKLMLNVKRFDTGRNFTTIGDLIDALLQFQQNSASCDILEDAEPGTCTSYHNFWKPLPLPPSSINMSLETVRFLSFGQATAFNSMLKSLLPDPLPPQPTDEKLDLVVTAAFYGKEVPIGLMNIASCIPFRPNLRLTVIVNQSCCASAFFKTTFLENIENHNFFMKFIEVPDSCMFEGAPSSQLGELLLSQIKSAWESPIAHLCAEQDAENTWHINQLYCKSVDHTLPLTSTVPGWDQNDTIIVTGGAKGITARCCLGLMKRHKFYNFALLGSSSESDSEVQKNLAAMREASTNPGQLTYYQCDITDPEALANTLLQITHTFASRTWVVIHAAARNSADRIDVLISNPARLEKQMQDMQPKVAGMQNLCNWLHNQTLGIEVKRFLAFSSLIRVTGMYGNSMYGWANEQMERYLLDYCGKHPETISSIFQFGAWKDTGMAVKMGSLSFLQNLGFYPIAVEDGVNHFLSGIQDSHSSSLFITPGCDTPLVTSPIPDTHWKFVHSFVITEANKNKAVSSYCYSLSRNPWIKDHLINKDYLIPAVVLLEQCLETVWMFHHPHNIHANSQIPIKGCRFKDITFLRAFPVSKNETQEICVRVTAIRSAENPLLFACEISALNDPGCQVTVELLPDSPSLPSESLVLPEQCPLPIQIEQFYSSEILFHGPSFQTIQSVLHLTEKEVVAKIGYQDVDNLQGLLLGSFYMQDGVLQASQLTSPEKLLVPKSFGTIEIPSLCALRSSSYLWSSYKDHQIDIYDSELKLVQRIRDIRTSEHPHDWNQSRPMLEDLKHLSKHDQKIFSDHCTSLATQFCLSIPQVLIRSEVEPNAFSDIEVRHEAQTQLLKMHYTEGSLQWENRKPTHVSEDHPANQLHAISATNPHSSMTALAVGDANEQVGIDIQPLDLERQFSPNSLDQRWYSETVGRLSKLQDSRIIAMFRCWTCWEAAFKATGIYQWDNIEIVHQYDSAVVLRVYRNNPTHELFLLTFPFKFTLGTACMCAITCQLVPWKLPKDDRCSDYNTGFVWCKDPLFAPNKQLILRTRRSITFSEIQGADSTVRFPTLFKWFGETREQSLLNQPDVRKELLTVYKDHKMGSVTNYVHFQLFGEFSIFDLVETDFWLENFNDQKALFCADWRVAESSTRIASAKMLVSSVKISDNHDVSMCPWPRRFYQYLVGLGPQIGFYQVHHLNQKTFSSVAALHVLHKKYIHTSHTESNLIGNIYFAQYACWFQQLLDEFTKANDKKPIKLQEIDAFYLQDCFPDNDMLLELCGDPSNSQILHCRVYIWSGSWLEAARLIGCLKEQVKTVP